MSVDLKSEAILCETNDNKRGMSPKELEKLKLIVKLIKFYPNTKIDKQGALLYLEMLNDIPLEIFEIAVNKIITKNNFFPTVAEIRKAAQEINATLHPELHIKTADEAWREVMQQMKLAFPYKSPHFSTEEIREAVSTLGWMVICETSSDKMGITRAQFRDVYKSIIKCKKDREENLKIIASMPKGLENSALKKLLVPERKFVDATLNKGVLTRAHE